MLTLNTVAKTYGSGVNQHRALKGLDLQVAQGEFFTLLGPSGCGKTTALRCVAGLEVPTAGEIRIGGELVFSGERGLQVPANKRDVAMVFQSYAIWPHMTVAQNVGFPLDVQHVRGAEKQARVGKALEMVGLSAMANRPATNLSGGQQQRVSLARAIIRGAKILLLDEPLSNLDAGLRVEMRRELRELQRMLGVTTLFVTHDQEEAMSMSDRVAIFNQGELVELGKPIDLYLRPARHFTATFLGLADLIPCKVLELSPAGGSALLETSFGRVLSACPGAGVQDQRSLLIRPEHIVLDAIGAGKQHAINAYQGIITAVSFGGRYVDYQVKLGDCTLAAQASSLQVHEVGTRVGVHMPPERCVLLND